MRNFNTSTAFGQPEAIYLYRAEDDTRLFEVLRFPGKKWRTRQPDGKGGGWLWSRRGIKPTLYRLPELLAAPPDQPAFLVEGEKDADRLASLGLVATTSP